MSSVLSFCKAEEEIELEKKIVWKGGWKLTILESRHRYTEISWHRHFRDTNAGWWMFLTLRRAEKESFRRLLFTVEKTISFDASPR